ncbi:MAG: response regulator [Spirochaetaceae bacterium]|jgi:two-component system response regulator YesN|nr:response regulator [Spirochaetaceae bacterium]
MNGYSFVIVDDEPEIREGIRDTIPWEDLGFSFAGACANGFEALELAERIQPDVVMTDINMPFMDGLAFTDRLAALCPAAKVLIITGYDDFEYVRKALQLQVYDYIVKPITPGELEAALEKLKATLDGERAERLNLEHIKRQLAESIPLLRERFLAGLIEGKPGRDLIRERAAYFDLSLPLEGAAYQCLTVDFVRRREGENFDMDLLTQRNILEQALDTKEAPPVRGILFQDREDRLTLLAWGADPVLLYREGLKTAEFLHRTLLSLGLKDSVIGVGEPVENLESLPVSWGSAADALRTAAFRGKSGVAAYREVMGKSGAALSAPDLAPSRGREWEKKIAAALKTGARDEAGRLVGEMVRYFQHLPSTIEELRIRLALVLAALIRCCEDMDIPEAEIFPPGMDPFSGITGLTSLDAVRLWFVGLTERIAAYIQTRQENFAQVKVREALEYLESRYADPSLSLQSLCKKLDISMSYFSANLKKYHDKTFVEELTAIRLGKAMELLRTTDLMTYEIADKVGYRDAHYFSLSFRKYTGLTATEYRNAGHAHVS